jgi:hypothetical protein
MNTNFDAEKYRESKYKEACEEGDKLEKERLNKIFAVLGGVESHSHLTFRQAETLEKVRNGVESGDRRAMLELLGILTDSLRVFETLSREVRLALADGLEKMQYNLEEAKGFLPRKQGERSKEEKRDREFRAFLTTMRVEDYRVNLGLSLDKAEAKVADESSVKQDLVHKYWKQEHLEAKQQVKMMNSIFKMLGADPHSIFQRGEKKVR